MTELKNRSLNYIFIARVDGLKGFPEAIETVFPHTEVQFVGWKQRQEVTRDLKTIYTSATETEAETRFAEFAEKWDAD